MHLCPGLVQQYKCSSSVACVSAANNQWLTLLANCQFTDAGTCFVWPTELSACMAGACTGSLWQDVNCCQALTLSAAQPPQGAADTTAVCWALYVVLCMTEKRAVPQWVLAVCTLSCLTGGDTCHCCHSVVRPHCYIRPGRFCTVHSTTHQVSRRSAAVSHAVPHWVDGYVAVHSAFVAPLE